MNARLYLKDRLVESANLMDVSLDIDDKLVDVVLDAISDVEVYDLVLRLDI